MDRQPTLTGERLLLRPLRADDWEALFAVAADRELWAIHPWHNRWQEPVFRGYLIDALENGGALAVIDREALAIIGCSQYQRHKPAESVVEVGWTFLARSHWGGAANRELKRLMLSHALRNVERVIFRVGEGNIRSRRALEKIGARLTDESEVVESAGVPVRHVIYEIDRADFASGPLA